MKCNFLSATLAFPLAAIFFGDCAVADAWQTRTEFKAVHIETSMAVGAPGVTSRKIEIYLVRSSSNGGPNTKGHCWASALLSGALYTEAGLCIELDDSGDQLWSSYKLHTSPQISWVRSDGTREFFRGTGRYKNIVGTSEFGCDVSQAEQMSSCTGTAQVEFVTN
jgi:hypothetical protein